MPSTNPPSRRHAPASTFDPMRSESCRPGYSSTSVDQPAAGFPLDQRAPRGDRPPFEGDEPLRAVPLVGQPVARGGAEDGATRARVQVEGRRRGATRAAPGRTGAAARLSECAARRGQQRPRDDGDGRTAGGAAADRLGDLELDGTEARALAARPVERLAFRRPSFHPQPPAARTASARCRESRTGRGRDRSRRRAIPPRASAAGCARPPPTPRRSHAAAWRPGCGARRRRRREGSRGARRAPPRGRNRCPSRLRHAPRCGPRVAAPRPWAAGSRATARGGTRPALPSGRVPSLSWGRRQRSLAEVNSARSLL